MPLFFQDTQTLSINLKDYVINDGTTDDAAIVNPIIAAAPLGSAIFFPPSMWIGSTLNFKSGLRYYGAAFSSNGSIIKQINGKNLSYMAAVSEFLGGGSTIGIGTLVENLYFDGNSANNTGTWGLVMFSSNSTVRSCWFNNVPQHALVFSDRTSSGTVITNSSIENHIENCKIITCSGYGIWIRDTLAGGTGTTSGKVTDGYIMDCIVSNSANSAIFVERGAGWFLRGNHVYNCQTQGIVLSACWSTFVLGNEIDGYGVAQPTTSSTSVTSGTTSAITVASTAGMVVGNSLLVDSGGSQDTITIASITGSSVAPSANWGHSHSGTYAVSVTGFFSGIQINAIGPRATVVEGNIISNFGEPNANVHYQYLGLTAAAITTTKIIAIGNHIQGGYVNSTSTSTLVSGAATACTPASMDGIAVGVQLTVDSAGTPETITVASITSTSFTPSTNWVNNHGPSSFTVKVTTATSFSQGILCQSNSTQTGGGFTADFVVFGNRVNNCGKQGFVDSNSTTNMAAAVEHVSDLQADRHLLSNATNFYAAATLAALASNGGSPPTPTFSSAGGTDVRGRVLLGSGTSPSSGDQVSVTYNKAYVLNPMVILTAANSATAALGPYVSATNSTTGFNIGFATAPTASQSGSTYAVNYVVIG